MLGFLFLIGSILFGIGIVKRLFSFTNLWERLFWGIALGPAMTTWLMYILARVAGDLHYTLVVTLTLAIWGLILFESYQNRVWLRRPTFSFAELKRSKLQILLIVLFGGIFGYFFYRGMFHPRDDGLYLTATSWYDMALHATIANSFAYGQNFPPANTFLLGEPLLYPFLPDFQAAVLIKASWGPWPSFAVTDWLMAMSLVGVFYSFAQRLTDSQRAAFISTLFFFFSGGLGFLLFLTDWRASGQSLFSFFWNMKENYTDVWSRGIKFMNLITSGLIPERAFLYGLTLSFIVLAIFAEVWKNWSDDDASENKWISAETFAWAGAISALLTVFYTHAYAVVWFVSCVLFALRPRRVWLAFWAPALLLGLPHVLHLRSHLTSGSFLRFHPGWVSYTYPNFMLFVIRNFGLLLLLGVPAFFCAPKYLRVFYMPFLALLIFAFLFIISPNDIDNIKLIYYWYGATAVLVAVWLTSFPSRPIFRRIVIVLVLGCVASGALAIIRESKLVWKIFSPTEIESGIFARDNLAPKALFLTGQYSNQPVLCLAGKPIVLGYDFWIMSHGYSRARYDSVLRDIESMYHGGAGAETLLHKYRVHYIYLGPHERDELKANDNYFDQHFKKVFHNTDINIYDCSAPRA
jgi:hypothetical protein